MRRRYFTNDMIYVKETLGERRRRLKGTTLFALTTGLLCGFVTGYLFTIATNLFSTTPCSLEKFHPYNAPTIDSNKKLLIKEAGPHVHNFTFRNDDSVANKLNDEVRILCWVLTSSTYHKTRAAHVKHTWGRRCNKLIFFSNASDTDLKTVVINETTGINKYWNKTMQIFDYLYTNHYHDADWFIKADDSTYIILENLRYLLYHYSRDEQYYSGCRYRHRKGHPGSFMVDKAGYVLSRQAVQTVAIGIIPHYYGIIPSASLDWRTDIKLGYLLGVMKVKIIDSRDSLGKERFHPFNPSIHVFEVYTDNAEMHEWWNHKYYQSEDDLTCCSDTAISFSYMSPAQMYAMEYSLYYLRPYGILRY